MFNYHRLVSLVYRGSIRMNQLLIHPWLLLGFNIPVFQTMIRSSCRNYILQISVFTVYPPVIHRAMDNQPFIEAFSYIKTPVYVWWHYGAAVK